MNILIITFDPPRNVGGIEGRANNYSKHLVNFGHFVEVLSFSPKGDFSKDVLHGATVINFPSSSRRVITAFRRTVKEISNNSVNSIFLLSGALTFYGLLILYYARRKDIKTTVLYYGKDILSARKNFLASVALRFSPKLAKKIVVNSHYTAGLLPKKYSEKIEILYPSVDPGIIGEAIIPESDDSVTDENSTSAEKNDFVGKIDSPNLQERTILFVGRLVKRKGVDDLLNAFKIVRKRFPNSKLEIVGDGPELSSLQRLAGELGIVSSVKFYGSLSGSTLYKRYKACDVFVMPSKTTEVDVEGFGTVFLEAGLFGKPCIGTRSGGIPEAVQDGTTGILVPEGDVPSLSEALERILSDADLADSLGKNARTMILANFTWDKSTRHLISILEQENDGNF